MYRILTSRGYYWTIAGGRYGRIDGSRAQAEQFCEQHALACVGMLKPLGFSPAAISVQPAQATLCAACLRVARRKGDV